MRVGSSNRILASMALAAILVVPLDAFAQDSNTGATLMRYTAEPTSPQRNIMTSTRVAGAKRPRTRVFVEPRSFLDAGTEVLPGQRKFLDYALPPTHTPMDVVQNTGGRVGWHNSPLPGPFFPW